MIAPRRGFSLASVLLVLAVAAVFFATLRAGQTRERFQDKAPLAAMLACAAVIGAGLGVVVGSSLRRGWVGRTVGLLAGLCGGAGAGLLMIVPESLLPAVFGSAVVVLFALLVRRLSDG